MSACVGRRAVDGIKEWIGRETSESSSRIYTWKLVDVQAGLTKKHSPALKNE